MIKNVIFLTTLGALIASFAYQFILLPRQMYPDAPKPSRLRIEICKEAAYLYVPLARTSDLITSSWNLDKPKTPVLKLSYAGNSGLGYVNCTFKPNPHLLHSLIAGPEQVFALVNITSTMIDGRTRPKMDAIHYRILKKFFRTENQKLPT